MTDSLIRVRRGSSNCQVNTAVSIPLLLPERAFRSKFTDESYRTRLRVEVARLRSLLRTLGRRRARRRMIPFCHDSRQLCYSHLRCGLIKMKSMIKSTAEIIREYGPLPSGRDR